MWPTIYGRRLAAFHVGKGCKLIYSPSGLLTTPQLRKSEAVPQTQERVGNMVVVVSPLGNLFTVSVPFPCLMRFVMFKLLGGA